jgi:hypothetical protein
MKSLCSSSQVSNQALRGEPLIIVLSKQLTHVHCEFVTPSFVVLCGELSEACTYGAIHRGERVVV